MWMKVQCSGENEVTLEDSFSLLSLVVRCSPENQRLTVELLGYINVWALVYKHAETQVRKMWMKVTRARESNRGVGHELL